MRYGPGFPALVFLLCLTLGACASAPVQQTEPGDGTGAHIDPEIERALQAFRALPELQVYFDEAKAVVIIPRNFRAGTGFGGAVGKGWLLEEGRVSATVWHWQFLAGADLGFQFYQQILFLKDAEAVAFFKNEPFQFAGQVNATALVWGAALTPSYNQGVALFTVIDGGLMLEGSVGLHSYHVFPL
ncbi:hypothetical protein [Ketobacter sp.]|uniref:hypothetical protein n=1 Tax=Ketobacter sp. TaxID=2083498 RepID=UPI000F20895C|nr:hypothetical protein [Ketobacter sp.]RLU01131.1 MAG: hypothetical protein D9N14_04070 [Ketobacter sp.]